MESTRELDYKGRRKDARGRAAGRVGFGTSWRRKKSLHIAPIETQTDFHFQWDGEFVYVLHLFAH